MKRTSSSAELEPEAKRRRVDVEQETLAEESQVMDVTEDIPDVSSRVDTDDIKDSNKEMDNHLPPIDPIAGAITPNSVSVHNATTICDLPLEVLGNHVFKFFDFEYWLKHFVAVCKYWQLAAEQSTVDKQLRIRRRLREAYVTIKRYKVSTLIIKYSIQLHDLANLINASPRVHSVKCNASLASTNNWTFLLSLPPKFTFSNVSTLFINGQDLQILRFFPNVSRVCLSNRNYQTQFITNAVKELAIPETTKENIVKVLRDMKIIFPALHTIYFKISDKNTQQDQQITEEELDAISEELGLSLIYSLNLYKISSRLPGTSYAEYFYCCGRTLFRSSLTNLSALQEVFQQFPTLTLEYELDFITRTRCFTFPRVEPSVKKVSLATFGWSVSEEILTLCYEKNMLPPAGLVAYYIARKNYKEIPVFASANLEHIRNILVSFADNSQSLVQLSHDLGAELFKQTVTKDSFCQWMRDNKKPFEDLTPIRGLISTEVIKYTYKRLIYDVYVKTRVSDKCWQYLVLFDSWLHPSTSRRVADQQCIGVQYLSDEAQAKYFAKLMNEAKYDLLAKQSDNASKPLNQIFHKGRPLLFFFNFRAQEKIIEEFKLDVNQVGLDGMTPLIHAINQKNVQRVVALLALGADPNFAGNTLLPLHYSLLQKEMPFEIITALLSYGADVNKQDYDSKGRTVWPITIGLRAGPTTVKYLLQIGADPTVINAAGNTLLHLLCQIKVIPDVDQFVALTKLLSTKININAKNNMGDTLLHIALAENYKPDIIKTILECGADVNLPDAHGSTPLILACYHKDGTEVIKTLLATHKVDIKAKTKNGRSFLAEVFDFMDIAKINLQDDEFKALCKSYLTEDNFQFLKDECKEKLVKFQMADVVSSNINFAKFLVELGYDVKENSFDLMKYIIESATQNCEVFDYLLANGLDVNAKDWKEEPTLLLLMHKSTRYCEMTVKQIQLLLKHGASVTEKNSQGIAPIDVDPLIETRYANGLHVDYFYNVEDKNMPDVNLVELRQSNKS